MTRNMLTVQTACPSLVLAIALPDALARGWEDSDTNIPVTWETDRLGDLFGLADSTLTPAHAATVKDAIATAFRDGYNKLTDIKLD